MATTDSGIVSPGEVESPLQTNQQNYENQTLQSIGRQLSIYSLTLDEFQHTLCESGKNFGSMNMDEFLNSIWSAEENQAQSHPRVPNATAGGNNDSISQSNNNASKGQGIERQHSLTRQGSLTIPAPLCRKTVEEVWSEIHSGGNNQATKANTTQRQATFGEMTLEDFLVKAGVVREQGHAPSPPQQLTFGLHQNSIHPPVGPNFGPRPAMTIGGSGGAATFPVVSQGGVGEVPAGGGMKRGGGYSQQPPSVGYGGRMGNGSGGGFGQVLGSPVSPVSSDGLCMNPGDGGNQYGLDMGGVRGGRKRIIDGPVEKVVERRQRRMIKNRESAARSRARKQAYTVELEAELNQLKEENAHLHHVLAELERQRKKKSYEETRGKADMLSKAQRANGKLRAMRRTMSCIY